MKKHNTALIILAVCSCHNPETAENIEDIPTYDLRESREKMDKIYLGRFSGFIRSYTLDAEREPAGFAEYDGNWFNIWIAKNEDMKCFSDQGITGCDNASSGIMSANLQLMIVNGPIMDGTATIVLSGATMCISSSYTVVGLFDDRYRIMVDSENLTEIEQNCDFQDIEYFLWQLHRTTKQNPPPDEMVFTVVEHVT